MFSTPAASVATSSTIAALLTATFFGVSVANIAIGVLIVSAAVIGRGGVEIAKTIEAGDQLRLARSIGWMGAGCASSPFVSMIYFAALAGIHYPVDAFSIIILGSIGYAGPKGVTALVTRAQALIPGRPLAPPNGVDKNVRS